MHSFPPSAAVRPLRRAPVRMPETVADNCRERRSSRAYDTSRGSRTLAGPESQPLVAGNDSRRHKDDDGQNSLGIIPWLPLASFFALHETGVFDPARGVQWVSSADDQRSIEFPTVSLGPSSGEELANRLFANPFFVTASSGGSLHGSASSSNPFPSGPPGRAGDDPMAIALSFLCPKIDGVGSARLVAPPFADVCGAGHDARADDEQKPDHVPPAVEKRQHVERQDHDGDDDGSKTPTPPVVGASDGVVATEPATVALVATGLIAFVGIVRRRR